MEITVILSGMLLIHLQISVLLTLSVHEAFFCVTFEINSTENMQSFVIPAGSVAFCVLYLAQFSK